MRQALLRMRENPLLRMKKDTSILSKRIRQARINSHISQSELGKVIGVSDKSVSAYESGRAVPSFEKITQIAKATNHSMNYFTEKDAQTVSLEQKLAAIEKELVEVKKLLKTRH